MRRINRASACRSAIHPEMTLFLVFFTDFGVNWIPTSFPVFFMVRAGEEDCLYLRRCLSFRLDCVRTTRKVNYTYSYRIV